MQRIYAHRILFGGVVYEDHVAQLDDEGQLTFFPFEQEIHSTRFYSGTVRVSIDDKRNILLAQESGGLEEIAE